jgi:hypothetical protein
VNKPFLSAAITAVSIVAGLALTACSTPTPMRTPGVFHDASVRTAVGARSSTGPTLARARAADAAAARAVHVTAAPTQLPAFKGESWVAQAPGPVLTVTGHDIGLNECARIDGATTWQQQGYESSRGDSAILDTFTFRSAAAASAAYAGALAGMQHCQATSRALQAANHITADAVCAETARAAGAEAFERTWTGVQGMSAAGPQINHLYIAVRGSVLVDLHFDQLNITARSASAYSVRNDPAVLSMLTELLTVRA